MTITDKELEDIAKEVRQEQRRAQFAHLKAVIGFAILLVGWVAFEIACYALEREQIRQEVREELKRSR